MTHPGEGPYKPLTDAELAAPVPSTGQPHYTAGATGNSGNVDPVDGWSGQLPLNNWHGWDPVHSTGLHQSDVTVEPPAVRNPHESVWPAASTQT